MKYFERRDSYEMLLIRRLIYKKLKKTVQVSIDEINKL